MRRRTRRRRTMRNTVVFAVLSVVLAGAWWWWRGRLSETAAADAPTAERASVAVAPPQQVVSAASSITGLSPLPAAPAVIAPPRPSPGAGVLDALRGAVSEFVAEPDRAAADAHGQDTANRATADEPSPPAAAAMTPDEPLQPVGPTTRPALQPVTPKSEPPAASPAAPRAAETPSASENPTVQAALKRYRAGQVIDARHELNNLLKSKVTDADAGEVRALLTRIADETLFSGKRVENDPLLEVYRVESGDVLARLAKPFNVPPETVLRVNQLSDPRKLRAGQTLLIPRGPFHARISKSQFRLDVYLQDLYIRSFRVGLGAERGTPAGVWKVSERLPNPTYYPPASATDKRIIPPHDPRNPLGSHWIGIEGVEGDALGKHGYGIHGTIEPDSIGRNASLGCVRMLNEDVALVYALLAPGASTVTIVP